MLDDGTKNHDLLCVAIVAVVGVGYRDLCCGSGYQKQNDFFVCRVVVYEETVEARVVVLKVDGFGSSTAASAIKKIE